MNEAEHEKHTKRERAQKMKKKYYGLDHRKKPFYERMKRYTKKYVGKKFQSAM